MIFYSKRKAITLWSLFFSLAYTGFFVDQARAQSPTAKLECGHLNYKEYIFDARKTLELISKTGKGCQLVGVNFAGTNLRGAKLRGANLRRAKLRGANLQGANLQEAKLDEAKLDEADLRGADLRRADLQGAYLYLADLRRADIRRADIQEANLYLADLQGAHLQGAHLQGAHLQGAKLQGADLRGANLRGANLRGTDLRGVKLEGAQYNDKTTFPSWFTKLGEGLVKGDPCSREHDELNELSFWERLMGVQSAASLGEQGCPTEGTASINNEDKNSISEKSTKDSESDTQTEGVIR